MKSLFAAPVGAILLLVSSGPLIARELPFNAPSTNLAQQNMELLHRAAHALQDSAPDASRISGLWLFPTNDANTVFAEYTLRRKGQSASSTEHLVELTLRADRVLRMRDLTGSVVEPRNDDPPSLDWTAMVGTGGTTKPASPSASVADPGIDEPASLDWTAMIGTGGTTKPASPSAGASPSPSGGPMSGAVPDWTSKIGTGNAANSNSGSKTSVKAPVIFARTGSIDAPQQ